MAAEVSITVYRGNLEDTTIKAREFTRKECRLQTSRPRGKGQLLTPYHKRLAGTVTPNPCLKGPISYNMENVYGENYIILFKKSDRHIMFEAILVCLN